MRLAFHYHSPANREGDDIKISGNIGLFIDSLAAVFDEVVCFLHTSVDNDVHNLDYVIDSKNVRLVDMGPHTSLPSRLKRVRFYTKLFVDNEQHFDVLIIRAPTPLSFFIGKALRKPVFFYLVGDYVDAAKGLNNNFIKQNLVKAWAWYYNFKQTRYLTNKIVLVNSEVLQEDIRPFAKGVYLIKSSTLKAKDFYRPAPGEDRQYAPPYKLLYTGRLTTQKSLEDIISACRILKEQGIETEFHLAGSLEKGEESYLDQLRELAGEFNFKEQVIYHGKLKIGEELNSLYRQCHAYVLASKSEGFPRVIWEALANRLPVVSTRVGSIPGFLTEGKDCLLVDVGRPDQLAEAVRKVLSDEELRVSLIQNGMQAVADNTLENRAAELKKVIEENS